MSYNFPDTPTVGQAFGNYTWDGEKWMLPGNVYASRSSIYAAPFDAMAYNGMQINGSMEVSQEFAVNVVSTGPYVCDVWTPVKAGTMVLSASKIAANALPGLTGITYCINVAIGTAQPSLGAGDYAAVSLTLEGYRIARLAWGTANAQPVTIGFWTAHGRTGTHSVKVGNSAGNRSYAAAYTQNVASTWQYNVITIPGCVDGSWANDNTGGLSVSFAMACGTTYTAPSANTWLASNYLAAPGQVNGVATTTSDAFRITGVVVLPGIEAPSAARSPLIMRPFDQELMLCRRYWQQVYAAIDIPNPPGGSPYATGVAFGVPMRAAPTTLTAVVGSVGTANCTTSVGDAQPYGCYFQMVPSTAARAYWYGTIKADARL